MQFSTTPSWLLHHGSNFCTKCIKHPIMLSHYRVWVFVELQEVQFWCWDRVKSDILQNNAGCFSFSLIFVGLLRVVMLFSVNFSLHILHGKHWNLLTLSICLPRKRQLLGLSPNWSMCTVAFWDAAASDTFPRIDLAENLQAGPEQSYNRSIALHHRKENSTEKPCGAAGRQCLRNQMSWADEVWSDMLEPPAVFM